MNIKDLMSLAELHKEANKAGYNAEIPATVYGKQISYMAFDERDSISDALANTEVPESTPPRPDCFGSFS